MRILSAASGVFSLVSIEDDAGSEARDRGRGVGSAARDRRRFAGSTVPEGAAPSAPAFPGEPRESLGVDADLGTSPEQVRKRRNETMVE